MDRNDRILVTGGTGFLGGRLVETLARQGAQIRVATSDFRHCSRAARFPVELVKADLLDHDALARAAADCDVVFHFAYRFGGSAGEHLRANVEGTRVLSEALLKNGGRRFVHISSVSAYGAPRDGELVETSAPLPTTDIYCKTKLAIDQVLLELHRTRGLPVTILQPTIVYGPNAPAWTIRLLEQVRTGRIVLPADGLGLCNAVYVDDVIAAAMLAMKQAAAVGEAFLVSGSSPVTWGEFYGAYQAMVDKQAIVYLDDEQARIEARRQRWDRSIFGKLRRELTRRPAVRDYLLSQPPLSWLEAGARQLPAPAQAALRTRMDQLWSSSSPASLPLFLPDAGETALFAAKLHVNIDKARKALGYEPVFDLASGMALTRQWAQWANQLTSE
jgi:nucleoside-diphosphate-sugar epimerase